MTAATSATVRNFTSEMSPLRFELMSAPLSQGTSPGFPTGDPTCNAEVRIGPCVTGVEAKSQTRTTVDERNVGRAPPIALIRDITGRDRDHSAGKRPPGWPGSTCLAKFRG